MRWIIAKRSGVHRAACFALYRSFLRAIVWQPAKQQETIQTLVRGNFRRDALLQSPRIIVAKLKNGYQALRYLTAPSTLSHEEIHRLKQVYSVGRPPPEPKQKPVPPERIWPYPGAGKVLEIRPLPRSALPAGKKRYVPTLVGAAGIPFLRFKKPQSRFLSRVLRQKLSQRQRRHYRIERMEKDLQWASGEDQWDKIVEQAARDEAQELRQLASSAAESKQPLSTDGIDQLDTIRSALKADSKDHSWTRVIKEEIHDVRRAIDAARQKDWENTMKMWKIVKQERELKIQEEGEEAWEAESRSRKGIGPRHRGRNLVSEK